MKYLKICNNCIIKSICSEPCYKSLAIVKNGTKVINWIFEDDPYFDAEGEYGVSKGELLKYFWQSLDGIDIKFEDLRKLKRKTIKIAQIVHGTLFVDDMRAVVLPNKKLAVDVNNLG